MDEGNEWTNIHTFDCFDGKSGQKLKINSFNAIDIDEDGNYEIILYIYKLDAEGKTLNQGSELFKYYNGKVYGYNINSYMYISGNGGYMSWCGPYTLEADYRDYKGKGKFSFIDDKLICTYVFEDANTKEEWWLRKSGILNADDKIVYEKETYEIIEEKYNNPTVFLHINYQKRQLIPISNREHCQQLSIAIHRTERQINEKFIFRL